MTQVIASTKSVTENTPKKESKDIISEAEKLKLKNIIPDIKTFETSQLKFLNKLGEGKFLF